MVRPPSRLGMHADADGMVLEPAAELTTDWAVMHPLAAAGETPLHAYMEAVSRANGARLHQPVPTGWCSWYHFFEKVRQIPTPTQYPKFLTLTP